MKPDNSKIVLWVDDDERIRRFGKSLVSRFGYGFDSAENGDRALELLSERRYDLMITDVTMPPGMNGWELAERASRKYDNMDIAILTDSPPSDLEKRKNHCGVNHVLDKPVSMKKLKDLLNLVLYEK
jgi:CheY-like chemotaxis protein